MLFILNFFLFFSSSQIIINPEEIWRPDYVMYKRASVFEKLRIVFSKLNEKFKFQNLKQNNFWEFKKKFLQSLIITCLDHLTLFNADILCRWSFIDKISIYLKSSIKKNWKSRRLAIKALENSSRPGSDLFNVGNMYTILNSPVFWIKNSNKRHNSDVKENVVNWIF